MKILVCFKPLPCWERVLESDWESFSLDTDLAYAGTAFNCFEEAAFELALRMKEQAVEQGQEGLCVAVTVGGQPSAPLTEGLYAAGFDEVVVLQDEAGEFSPRQVALRLSAFVQAGGFDLILTGIDSGVAGTGTVPFLLADRLGLPLLADVRELSLEEGGVSAVLQDKDGLWRRCLRLPALASVGNSPAVLRAVNLRARLQAKGRRPRLFEEDHPSARPEPTLSRPKTGRSCVFLTAKSPEDLAQELLTHHFTAEAQTKQLESDFPALPEGLLAVGYETPANPEAVLEDWKARKPALTLLPDTPWGQQLTAALANQENCSVLTGAAVRGFTPEGVQVQKKVCSANLVWTKTLHFPAVLTLMGKPPDSVDIISIPAQEKLELDGLLWETRLEAPLQSGLSNPELVIVCGAGMGSRESCDKARELAKRLGAGFGLTRPAALNGWGRPEEIVGQSGEKIAPRVCLVLGASGAGAFAAGIEDAGKVIAVNTDKNALIFRHADVGVAQDATALVAALLAII
jgi:electron transfer flavoprotein alpha subunit